MSDQVRGHIETVVIDCYWPYRKAVEEALPKARVVADKFHVIRSINAAAQRVRIRHARRNQPLGQDRDPTRRHNYLNPAFEREVWHSRGIFMKRAHKLSDAERAWLDGILEAKPAIGVGWLLKEEFAAIYDARYRPEAERRLEVRLAHINQAGLPEFKKAWLRIVPEYYALPVISASSHEALRTRERAFVRRRKKLIPPNRASCDSPAARGSVTELHNGPPRAG